MLKAPLRRDTRGASLVEYILLVGVIGLVAFAGVRFFNGVADQKAQEQADCIASLAGCSATGAGSRSSGSSVASATNMSAATASSEQTASSSSTVTASPSSNGGALGTARTVATAVGDYVGGIVTQGLHDAKQLGILAASITPPGMAYYSFTGKPNPAMQAVTGVAKLALSASAPGRIVAYYGGPDPLGNAVRNVRNDISAQWHDNKAATLGRATFEVATIVLPFAKAAKVVDIAEAGQKAGQLADVANVVSESEKAAEAANAARAAQTGAALTKATEADAIAAAMTRGAKPEILTKLGSGDFGTVYLADVDGTKIAVKVPHSAADLEIAQETVTPVQYGGVPTYGQVTVNVPGRGEVGGLAMKAVDGQTLEKVLAEPGQAPAIMDSHIERLVELKEQAAKQNLVYDALKPDNVMVGRDGQVYIIDNSVKTASQLPAGTGALKAQLTQGQFDYMIARMRMLQKPPH